MQPGACQLRQGFAHVLALHLLQRLADKRLDQQGARLRLGNAARLAVEQQILVKIGAGRAMAADDVVGVDLQLRLGVELGIRRQHQHLRHLLAVGLLRVRAHDDLALEDAARVPVEHALEQLAAGALGNRVVDDERRVDVLVAAGQEGAGQVDLAAGAGEQDADLVARQRRAGREVEAAVVGIGAEIDEPIGQVRAAAGFEGALHVRDGRTVADDDLGRRIELELLGRRRRRHDAPR